MNEHVWVIRLHIQGIYVMHCAICCITDMLGCMGHHQTHNVIQNITGPNAGCVINHHIVVAVPNCVIDGVEHVQMC